MECNGCQDERQTFWCHDVRVVKYLDKSKTKAKKGWGKKHKFGKNYSRLS